MHWLVKVTENKSGFALMFFSRSFCLKNISVGNKIAFNNSHDPALTLSLVFIYFQKNYFSFELFYKRYFLFDELDVRVVITIFSMMHINRTGANKAE